MTVADRDGHQDRVVWQETVPVTAERLAGLRVRMREIGADLGIDDESVAMLVLAMDEAIQNIIRHGYRETGTGPVDIKVSEAGGVLQIRLEDRAPPADLAAIRPRDLDELRPGGLGTHFIRTIMDEVTYSHAEDGTGNVLVMRWRFGERRAQD